MAKSSGTTRGSSSSSPRGLNQVESSIKSSGPFKGMELGSDVPRERWREVREESNKMYQQLRDYGDKNGYLNGVVGTFVPVTDSEGGYYQAVIEVESRKEGSLDNVVPYFRISDLQPHGMRDYYSGSETEAQKTREMKFKTIREAVAYAKKEAARINKKYNL